MVNPIYNGSRDVLEDLLCCAVQNEGFDAVLTRGGQIILWLALT